MIVNGHYTSQLNLADRATQYGDGCFTTIAVSAGKLEYWSEHLQRLHSSCARLHIEFTRWIELEDNLHTLAEKKGQGVLKVIISRGEGGRGYGLKGVGLATYIITEHDMPTHYRGWQQAGIKLNVSPIQLAKQPLLAGLKHLNRLEQVMIKRHLEQSVFDDCLVTDTDSMLVESSAGNLFWRQGDIWYTPELTSCGVEGVMRNQLFELIRQQDDQVQQIRATLDILQEADEVLVCNCLMKIVPVTSFSCENSARHFTFRINRTRALQSKLGLIIG